MPKISDERKLERSQQILDAARRCFIDKGFHRASMSDVIRESGLSAGAVYSYYSSKEELIAAVARSIFVAYETGINGFDDPGARPASPEAPVGGNANTRWPTPTALVQTAGRGGATSDPRPSRTARPPSRGHRADPTRPTHA